jgi:MinD superfamily P-loop ATPase
MSACEHTIAVAAGKGGTGKTLVSASLALALAREHPRAVQLVDCDVEEPNAHLLLHPQARQEQPVTVSVARVRE